MSYQTLVQSDRIAYATQQGATLNQIAIITADIPSRSTIYFANSNIFRQDGTLDTSHAVMAIDVFNKTVRVGSTYLSTGGGITEAHLVSTTEGLLGAAGTSVNTSILQLASTAIGVNDQSYHYNYDLLSTIAGGFTNFGPVVQLGLSTVARYTSNTSNYYKNNLVDYSSQIITISTNVTATSNFLKTLSPDISTHVSSLSTAISQTSNWSRGTLQDWSTSVSTVALYTSDTSNWASNLNQNWSSALSIATLYTSNTSNWSRNMLQDYSTAVSSVGLYTSNTSNWAVNLNQNWSSAVSTATLFTSNTSNWSKNMLQDYSTAVSSVGAFTSNSSNYFIANAGGSGTSSLLGVISSGFSTLAIYTSNTSNWSRGLLQDYSTGNSSISTALATTSNYILANSGGTGTSSLLGVVSSGLSSVAVFTSNTSNWSRGILVDWSTPVSSVALYTSNTSNWSRGILQDFSTGTSSVSLYTSNTSNYFLPALSNNYSTNLTSTVEGLGTAGYISTGQFLSSMLGMTSNISSMIDPVELASSVVGLGTVGFVSAIGLTAIMNSTVMGVNMYVSSMIDPVELTSSILGLGTQGFISSVGLDTRLASTVFGVNSNMYSTTSGTNIQIQTVYQYSRGLLQDFSTPVSSVASFTSNTSNWAKTSQQDWSTPISTLSTTYGYTFTSLSASVSTLTLQSFTAAVGSVSSLQVNALTIGTGTGIISLGDINTVSISSISTTAGAFYGTTIEVQQVVASSFRGDGSQLQNVAGLSSVYFYSRGILQDFSTGNSTVSLFTSNTSNWSRGLLQDYSTPVSTVFNYSKNILQDFSTPVSSVGLYTSNTSNWSRGMLQDWSTPVNTVSLYTTNTSNWARNMLQDWSTPVSSVALYTSNTSNWASNIQQNWSTAVSTATLYTSNTSNWSKNMLQDWSTPVSTVALYASNTSNWASNIQQNWSSAVSIATLYTSNTSNWSRGMLQDWSTPVSTVFNYSRNILQDFSTGNSTVSLYTSNTSNWAGNMLQDYSTPVSTVFNYSRNILQDWSTPVSSVALYTSNTSNWSRGMLQDYSTPVSTVFNYSRNLLQDFSTPVSSVALYTSNTSNWSRGILQDFSTGNSTVSLYTSNTSNWSRGILQDWSTPVNTLTLYAQNTSNWARGMLQDWSTPITTATQFTSNTSNFFLPTLSNNYSTNLTSTVAGLGTANYISASQLYSTVSGVIFNGSTNTLSSARIFTSSINTSFVTGTQGYISSLIVDYLGIGSNLGFINMGDIITTSHSTLQINTGVLTASGTMCTPQIIVSSINGQTLSQLATVPIQSTAIGLGTLGYISSAQFLSSMHGMTSNISTMIDPVELTSTVVGLGTVGFVSTIGLAAIMNSTVAGVNIYVSSMIDPVELTSTITGLGASGFISTIGFDAKLASTVQGLGAATYISATQLYSTVAGVTFNGSTITLSSARIFTSSINASFVIGAQGYISSLVVDSLAIGSNNGFIDMGDIITTSHSSIQINTGVLTASGTVCTPQIILSTINGQTLTQLITTPIQSTAIGLGTIGFISSSQLLSTQAYLLGLTSSGLSTVALYTSNTSNWASNVLLSTTAGLGSATYISAAQLYSTVAGVIFNGSTNTLSSARIFTSSLNAAFVTGTQGFISSLVVDSLAIGSNSGFINMGDIITTSHSSFQINTGLFTASGAVCTPQIIVSSINGQTLSQLATVPIQSTAIGLGTLGYISSSQLASTQAYLLAVVSSGLSSVALYTSNTSNWSRGILQDFSTGNSSVALYTSNTSNWSKGMLQDWSTPVSSVALFTSNTSNWSRNLLQDISTPVSSLSTLYGTRLTSLSAAISTLTLQNFTSLQGSVSSLQVNSLLIGTGTGSINLGDTVMTAVSSVSTATNTLYALNTLLGNVSSQTAIQFYGLTGQFNGTAIAEKLVSPGIQELLLYKASSISDQIRLQTTGNIVFEAGVVSRSWSTSTAAPTPTLYISYLSNVGIGTAAPATTLDVAGTGRFITVSTLNVTTSTINGSTITQLAGVPIQSTVIGLGTAGYISSTQLASTQALLLGITSTGLSSVALYTSNTSNWSRGLLQDFSTPVSSVGLFTSNTSNWAKGLAVDWSTPVSSVGLFTSNTSNWAKGLAVDWSTPVSSVSLFTSNTSNYAKGILQDWSTASQSTTAGLGSATYISATQLYSTVAGITFSGSTNTLSASRIFTSSLNASYVTSVQGYISSLVVDSLQLGFNNAFFEMGDVIATSLSTLQVNTGVLTATTLTAGGTVCTPQIIVSTINGQTFGQPIQSTVVGLGLAGYVSSIGFVSSGLSSVALFTSNTSNWSRGLLQDFSTPVSSVATFTSNTSNFFLPALSNNYSTNLTSTVVGLGTAGYISSGQFLSSMLGMTSNISTMIDPVELASSIVGLGTIGFTSSIGLTAILNSTVAGVNTYVSSMIDPVELASSITSLGTQGFISSIGFDAKLASTTAGLGTATYISATQLYSTVAGITFSGSTNTLSAARIFTSSIVAAYFTGTQGYISSLVVDSLAIGFNSGFINMGDVITTSLSSLQINTGLLIASGAVCTPQIIVSSVNGAVPLVAANITSSIIGLGTAGYLSSVGPLYGVVSTGLSSVAAFTSNTSNFFLPALSNNYSTNLQSTFAGLATGGYISSSQLFSTVTALTGSTLSLSAGSVFASSIQALRISTAQTAVCTVTFNDQRPGNPLGNVYQYSSVLYYNSFVVAGTTAMNIQSFTF